MSRLHDGARVSILTPSFGYARFLPTAMKSVSSSSVDVEHVIVDGGSVDGTVEILRESADTWISEPDQGQSDALNKALGLSTGEIIGWLNADDFYLPGAIEAVVSIFNREPDVDVVFGDSVLVDEHGVVLRVLKAYDPPRFVIENRGPVYLSTSTFFRREVLQTFPFCTDLRVIMDWDLFIHIHRSPQLRRRYVPRPIGVFRFHRDQVTSEGAASVPSTEMEHLRARHGLNAGAQLRRRRAAVALHWAIKLGGGSWVRQRASKRLAGVPLLTDDGSVDQAVADSLVRLAAPRRSWRPATWSARAAS